LSQLPDRIWGPLNLLSNGYCLLWSGLKRLGRDAEDSPPSRVQVKTA
jgi:hypothetical protein